MDDLQLTKKAEAYVAAAGTDIRAECMLTLQIDRTSRKSLAGSIEALIDLLDDLSPDPDLEDDGIEDIDEREPDNDTEANGDERDASYTAGGAIGGHWCEDVEEENEHGGDVLDQAHDGDSDNEPSLGWGNTTGQTGVGVEGWNDTDSEQFTAEGALGFTGEGHEEARQMLRQHRQALRPEPSLTIVGPVIDIPGWFGYGSK